jgi:hypothetical protein
VNVSTVGQKSPRIAPEARQGEGAAFYDPQRIHYLYVGIVWDVNARNQVVERLTRCITHQECDTRDFVGDSQSMDFLTLEDVISEDYPEWCLYFCSWQQPCGHLSRRFARLIPVPVHQCCPGWSLQRFKTSLCCRIFRVDMFRRTWSGSRSGALGEVRSGLSQWVGHV